GRGGGEAARGFVGSDDRGGAGPVSAGDDDRGVGGPRLRRPGPAPVHDELASGVHQRGHPGGGAGGGGEERDRDRGGDRGRAGRGVQRQERPAGPRAGGDRAAGHGPGGQAGDVLRDRRRGGPGDELLLARGAEP